MLDELQLFRGEDFVVNDYLTIHHPSIGEISDFGEQRYYATVFMLCATPSDYKVVLWDDMHLDWEQVDEFEFFDVLRQALPADDISLLLGNFPLKDLALGINPQNGESVLYSEESGKICFDRAAYIEMTTFLRQLHGLEKRCDVAGNEQSKRYLLEKERRAQGRRRKEEGSSFVSLVSGMVNCEQFKYDYDRVWDLPIYTFLDSVKRIQKVKNYDHLMQGAYNGTVDIGKISPDTLNWLGRID